MSREMNLFDGVDTFDTVADHVVNGVKGEPFAIHPRSKTHSSVMNKCVDGTAEIL